VSSVEFDSGRLDLILAWGEGERQEIFEKTRECRAIKKIGKAEKIKTETNS